MNNELKFLNIISSTIKDPSYLGDDCAYLKEYNLVISSDSLVEDVHFSFNFMNAKEIAKKALLVNISDILASGATVKYATINLSGKLDEKLVQEFYSGVNEIENELNIKIIGGDLTKADKLTIAVTVFGDCTNKNVSSRKNAKKDYVVALCGEFGSSAQGLEDLINGVCDNYFINYHKAPKLYPNVSSKISSIAKKPYAMMDSSDGLIDCLTQISLKSNVKIEIEYDKIPKKTKNSDFVLFGGEDYSLVVCLAQEDFAKIDGLVQVGKCLEGSGVFVDNKKIEYRSYNHFE